jgi:hypothetical protein
VYLHRFIRLRDAVPFNDRDIVTAGAVAEDTLYCRVTVQIFHSALTLMFITSLILQPSARYIFLHIPSNKCLLRVSVCYAPSLGRTSYTYIIE